MLTREEVEYLERLAAPIWGKMPLVNSHASALAQDKTQRRQDTWLRMARKFAREYERELTRFDGNEHEAWTWAHAAAKGGWSLNNAAAASPFTPELPVRRATIRLQARKTAK